MAEKLIKEMGLPKSMANVLAALTSPLPRSPGPNRIRVDALAGRRNGGHFPSVARIREIACPPYQPAVTLMEQQIQKEDHGGHLLGRAVTCRIPFDVTEPVGPAGIGKTQGHEEGVSRQRLLGQRSVKMAKSPLSPPLAFPCKITAENSVQRLCVLHVSGVDKRSK